MIKKRAQVTVFIIIGIILLLSAVFVGYLIYRQSARPVEEAIIVPEDVKPVHEFITTCLYQTSKRGVALMGQQAGFIYVPAIISNTYEARINLDNKGAFVVPFWYYEGEDRTPSLDFMQKELQRYVYEHLNECLGDLESFKGEYDIVEKDDLLPSVTIAEEDVVVKLKWPLQLTSLGKTTFMEDYVARLDVKLKKAHEIASKVMKYENDNSFFENFTINSMSADTEIPTDDMRFECKQRKWHLDDVTKRLQKILYYNLPIVRVENTQYVPFVAQRKYYERLEDAREDMWEELSEGAETPTPPKYTPSDAIEFFKYRIEAGVSPNDLKASFDYQPGWGMRLSAVPNSGGWLKSNTGRGDRSMIGFLCINQWHFTYDVIYPIRLTVKDDSAFAGEGFIFQMAFPVLVNDNIPERKYFGVRQFTAVDFDKPFCAVTGEQAVDIRATGFTEASPIETEMDNVSFTYRCLTEECILGESVADDGYYRLRTTVPTACINPVIVAEKDGYLPAEGVLKGDELTIPMKKVRPFDVVLVVHPYASYAGEWNPPRYKLRNSEKALVHVGLKGAPFEQYIEFPSNGTVLEFVEGKEEYNIDITLLSVDNPTGGYLARDVEIEYADFADADTVELHVFEYVPNPTKAATPSAEQLRMDMYTFMVNGNYTEKLRPTFR
ncbi:hypothetical protein KY338_03420 [Candidatus Woesearchaeota archaeon]|nr:hypothetical protein [Candidatus Woesearchaeota archaeon]MBW3005347.1 hypothetical protein [Candidatus Woesearchaeota archaeon]